MRPLPTPIRFFSAIACRSAVEEQRRILQQQMEEARERKRLEKEQLKLEESMEEMRVRSELANMESDSNRNKELSK